MSLKHDDVQKKGFKSNVLNEQCIFVFIYRKIPSVILIGQPEY